eukprot:Rhum_TRINITY_DN6969_c0_g2::Rhum_TRINITY_DN6969_c0_g2_i1::g.21260::m.21260
MQRAFWSASRRVAATQRRSCADGAVNIVTASLRTLQWDPLLISVLTEKGLRRQFYKLAQRHHPDVSRSGGDAEVMSQVNVAYSLLSDIVKKAGGKISVEVAVRECGACGGAGAGDAVLSEVRVRFACCTTEEEVNSALDYLWDLASRGCLPENDKIVAIALAQWALVLPLGVQHARCIVSTCEQWLSNTGETPPLDIMHDVLETYSDAFARGEICGSVLSSSWPQMVEFVQNNCEPNEYTFLIIRRLDPTIRI